MKYIAADDLSRRPRIKFNDINEEYIEDINDFITISLDIFRVFFTEF